LPVNAFTSVAICIKLNVKRFILCELIPQIAYHR
jgi:hypothetical protein